jgi:hypothetical protein
MALRGRKILEVQRESTRWHFFGDLVSEESMDMSQYRLEYERKKE